MKKSKPIKFILDQTRLDQLYKKYNTPEFIREDPIRFVYEYFGSKQDQEVVAFIVSCLSFGQRQMMIPFITKVLSYLNPNPYDSIINLNIEDMKNLEPLVYRFLKGIDILALFYRLHTILKEYGSLENLFHIGFKKEKSLRFAMSHFIQTLSQQELPLYIADKINNRSRNQKFLLASPDLNSACKRFHLFLRWMVRKDNVDIGLWKSISKSSLMIPLDTHVARMAKAFGLSSRKNHDWKMAEEITTALKQWDKTDPVKYDFALFGYGIEHQDTFREIITE